MISFKWNKPIDRISKEAWGGEKTLLFMAMEAKRLMDPYVPAKDLVLARNVRTYVEGNHGVMHYLSPYAKYQFNGMLMVSRITGSPWARRGESKILTHRPLKYSRARHPLASAKWHNEMKKYKGKAYARTMQSYVKGGGMIG